MKVEIISIGDELLIGQTVNTNASWMGSELSRLGARIEFCSVIRDDRLSMLEAFEIALGRVDVVLVTGGLGPTKDDFTKQVLCEFFDDHMVQNEDVLNHVKAFFMERNRKMLEVNFEQAMVPSKAAVLHNEFGTAPGMLFRERGKVIVSMPGVPYEMKHIMTEHVIPLLKKTYRLDGLYYRTIQTQGIGETYIAERIAGIENEIRDNGYGLAYLPSPGGVRLRLSSENTEQGRLAVESYLGQIVEYLPKYAFGYEDDTLEAVVGKLLIGKKATLGTVESCTGGAVSSLITTVPGSSNYFMGSIISYSNTIKMEVVRVKEATLIDHGAVSKEVVEEMAVGGRNVLKTDYTIAISGVAGPDGGTEEKPVGAVWVAIAGPDRVVSKKFQFEKDRGRNIRRSVLASLNMLRCELLEINLEKS